MRIEYGFQANHSGYWWDSAITVRFDQSVDLPGVSSAKPDSDDADDSHPSFSEDLLDNQLPLFFSTLPKRFAHESLMETPGLPIRKHRHGDMDDPEASLDLMALESFWQAATLPGTAEALANLSTANTLADAVQHLAPVLHLPSVRAVDVMLYVNGLEPWMPNAHAIFRFVPESDSRIVIRIALMDGDPGALRMLPQDLAEVLGWPDLSDRPHDSKQHRALTLCLAEEADHCSEYSENFYCSKADYDLVRSIYTAMNVPDADLDATLGGFGADLYRVIELAIRVELMGLLLPDPRPVGGPEPPHLTGKSRFWSSAAERAIAYLVRLHDSYNSSSVINLMSLASPTLAVPLFRHLLNQHRIEAVLLDRIRACRMSDLLPDLIALVERNVSGCYSGYRDFGSFGFSESNGFQLMHSVFLTIKELMPAHDYEDLLLSAYHIPPASEAPLLRFNQPFSVLAGWAFPGSSVISGESDISHTGRRRSQVEPRAEGHHKFLDKLLETILKTVEDPVFPKRLLETGGLSPRSLSE